MNAIQGSASSAGSQESPSSSEQPNGGIPYGSYGGSSAAGSYGSYGAYGSGNFGDPNGPGGVGGGGHWSGGNWGGSSAYPEPNRRKRRVRRGMAFGAAGLAIAAVTVGSYAAAQGGGSTTGHATTSSNTTLTTAQIAAKVDPGLVDVISTLGDQSATAEGTGIVLTSTGEVLTNNHVIDGATSVKVVDIGNGKTYTATVVGYDPTKDVAVLKLQNASGLQTAPLGNSSSVSVGQNVTALGNAEGKGGTPAVATGQVTALGQSITASDEGSSNSENLTGMIQSNAPIQPGDSGGSLVNSSGQVIGMDTAASSASDSPSSQADTPGASDGSGSGTGSSGSGTTTATQAFSIPINTAEAVANEIVAGDASSTVHIGATGFLGIEVAPADSSSTSGSAAGGSGDGGFGSTGGSSDGGFGSTGGYGDGGYGSTGGYGDGGYGSTGGYGDGGFGSTGGSSDGGFGSTGGTGTTTSGATVEGTLSGSPAAAAGLAAGDVITSVAGQTVTSPTQISSILSSDHPGDKVTVTWTDTSGTTQTATITLASGPAA
jgi:S1-C subfamily serine protease